MRKRKGSWIFFLPVLATLVSAGIVTHQHARRDRLRAEIKTTHQELLRLAELLPMKYRAQKTETAHQHREGDGHHH